MLEISDATGRGIGTTTIGSIRALAVGIGCATQRFAKERSTATRIEALRNLRRPSARSVAERRTLAERVSAIKSPMLIVVGSLDRLVPMCDRLHALVRHSQYLAIEGAPHNVYYEAAAAYNDAVDTFLTQVAR